MLSALALAYQFMFGLNVVPRTCPTALGLGGGPEDQVAPNGLLFKELARDVGEH